MDPATEPLSTRQIVTTRVVDAPRERVFRAWTDPGVAPEANEQNFDRLEAELARTT